MDFKDCRIDGEKHIELSKLVTDCNIDKAQKPLCLKQTLDNNVLMGELQDKLYAEGKEGIVIMLQAMDAAGKDSTIKHVMSGINPQGVMVTSFKAPSTRELSHDYMWRANLALPPRGYVAIFNRSYYEDVLVVRVHELQKNYAMPKRCLDMSTDAFFDARHKQIVDFEDYLYANGYRVVKIFLHLGPEEQKRRFLARIDDPSKNWKFSSSDIAERKLWDQYQRTYETVINATATKTNPWYVVPADQKWYARLLVSQIILQTLEDCDPHYPEMPEGQLANLGMCKEQLLAEVSKDPEEAARAAARTAEKAAKAAAKAAAALSGDGDDDDDDDDDVIVLHDDDDAPSKKDKKDKKSGKSDKEKKDKTGKKGKSSKKVDDKSSKKDKKVKDAAEKDECKDVVEDATAADAD